MALHRRTGKGIKKPGLINAQRVTFVLILAVGGAFLYGFHSEATWAPPFIWYDYGRWLLITAVLIFTMLEALHDNILAGLLCIFLIPFTLYYGAITMDRGWLKGAFLGSLLLFIADGFILRELSMATLLTDIGHTVYVEVNRLLARE